MAKCSGCSRPAVTGRWGCDSCLASNKRSRARTEQKWRDAGTTHYELYGKKWHQKNSEVQAIKMATYKKEQIASGSCASGCGQSLHWSNKNYCIRHACDRGKRYDHGVGFDRRMVMYENQGGACFICGAYEPDPVTLHVDHDHGSGVVRGLLCGTCNKGLGHFNDNPRLLLKAAAYIKEAPIGTDF